MHVVKRNYPGSLLNFMIFNACSADFAGVQTSTASNSPATKIPGGSFIPQYINQHASLNDHDHKESLMYLSSTIPQQAIFQSIQTQSNQQEGCFYDAMTCQSPIPGLFVLAI